MNSLAFLSVGKILTIQGLMMLESGMWRGRIQISPAMVGMTTFSTSHSNINASGDMTFRYILIKWLN